MTASRRVLLATIAVVCGAIAVLQFANPRQSTAQGPPGAPAPACGREAHGRALYVAACASCHGLAAGGIAGRGPSLRAVGARAADFYLSTGRMPLDDPHDPPVRLKPFYSKAERESLIAYVASLGGPPMPSVDVAHASLSDGQKAFTTHCAGCHQVVARGGIVTPAAIAPSLQEATPTQVAEAVRIGPYVMPQFSERQIDSPTLAAIARYVTWTRHPDNAGGWGIGNIGPIPEGMIAWLLAAVALVIVIRLIGSRTTT